MPIADPIASHWPPSLFEDRESRSSDAAWSAFHVRPRAEKVVARQLMSRESVGYFLPLSEQDRRYQRRRVRVQNLLFPGYVFAFGPNEDVRQCAYAVPGIVNHLQDEDQQSLHNSLAALKHMISTGAPVTLEDRLEPGMPVEIVSGPFVGYRGRVIENKRALRFVVELDFIQRRASVSVDGSMVKPL